MFFDVFSVWKKLSFSPHSGKKIIILSDHWSHKHWSRLCVAQVSRKFTQKLKRDRHKIKSSQYFPLYHTPHQQLNETIKALIWCSSFINHTTYFILVQFHKQKNNLTSCILVYNYTFFWFFDRFTILLHIKIKGCLSVTFLFKGAMHTVRISLPKQLITRKGAIIKLFFFRAEIN